MGEELAGFLVLFPIGKLRQGRRMVGQFPHGAVGLGVAELDLQALG